MLFLLVVCCTDVLVEVIANNLFSFFCPGAGWLSLVKEYCVWKAS